MIHQPCETKMQQLIKVCVSLCKQYVFVLTTQVLHVYSNIHSNLHLGRFTLDDEQYQRFGEFRDIVLMPGWRNFCLLMEKHKRVLVCTYGISQLGLDALVDFEIQRQMSWSNHGSPRNEGSAASSVHSLNLSQLRVQQKSLPEPIPKRGGGSYESKNIKGIKQHYEGLLEPVDIKLIYILALPAGVHAITMHDAQMYFWTVEHAGVYVTLCPEGFTNHLGCNVTDEIPIKLSLNLHATNLVRNMRASGTVSLSRGLCYLTFKDTLYTNAMVQTTAETNLYVLDNTTGGTINCLGDWITRSCSTADTASSRRDSTDFDLKAIKAESLLNDMEDNVAPGKVTLDEIVGSLRMEDVTMVAEKNACLFTTSSGSLVSINIARVVHDHIGQIVYQRGVSKITTDGTLLVALVEDHVDVLAWHGDKLLQLWKYKLENVRSISIYNHIIATLYNNDGLICFNALGKVLMHRRSRVDDDTHQSSCFAAMGLAIITTRASQLVMYRLYTTGYDDVHCSNPLNNVIAFVSADDIMLFHARMLEGTFGVAEKPISEDRHLHAYDNIDLIGDIDCGLYTLPLPSPQSRSRRRPLTRAVPNPTGSHLLCASAGGFHMYNKTWECFGDDLGECACMGWLSEQICFVILNVPMQLVIANRTLTPSHDMGNDVISLADTGISYCHFFHVAYPREHVEMLPLKHRPVCCTVFNETLYIMDETQSITGYELYNIHGTYKFDVVLQTKLEEPLPGQMREIHYLDTGVFAVVDKIEGLYRIQDGKSTKVLDGCSYVTSAVHVIDGKPTVVLLCSIRFHDKLTVVTAKECYTIQARLPPVALVDEGVVTYLSNLMDPSNNVQKIRIGKMPLPLTNFKDAMQGPFYMDALDKIITNVTEDKRAKKDDLNARCEVLPRQVKWRLIARQSRKRNLREEVKELEKIFECSLADIFENMLQCGREAEATFMLLALQSLTDPVQVRNKYNRRLMQMLATQISTSLTKESTLHLFQALLRFHHIVEEVDAVEVKTIALALMANCDIMAVYKLCHLFNIELSRLVQALRTELGEMYVWGICLPNVASNKTLTHASTEGQGKKVDVAHMILTLKMKLDLVGENKGMHVRDVDSMARMSARASRGNGDTSVLPHTGHGICYHLYDAFVAERLLVPAAAIAMAAENFLAISQLMLADQETNEVLNHVITQASECSQCQPRFNLIKHCLLHAKKQFAA